MKKIMVLIAVFTCFYSCGDTDDDSNSSEINIVTGIHLVDSFGNNVGTFGNPNVLNNVSFAMYPNPAIDVLSIVSSSSIKNIWILEGVPIRNFSNTNFNDVLTTNMYASSEIKSKSVFDIEDINVNNIKIDLNQFGKGYHRVFIELEDGSINWNNIYFRASQSDINALNFWN